MRPSLRIAATLIAWTIPFAAAAVPAPVRSITATEQGGSVRVTWQSVGTDVARYDVYVSRRSILDNSGEYDDVESTVGSRTEHVLSDLPATSGTLYVSVLAVDANGAESAFVEEAQVTLGAPAVPVVSQLQLLSANVQSMTGILLTFNAPVHIAREQANQALSVTYGSGKTLALTKIEVTGTTVLLTTAPQMIGEPYTITAHPILRGRDSMGNPGIPLDPFFNTATVLGGLPTVPSDPFPMSSSSNWIASSSASSASSSTSSFSSDPWVPVPSTASVLNLRLTAQRVRKGVNRVTATWETSGGNPASFTVRQSRDRGVTFGQAKSIPGAARTAQVDNVPDGSFGLSVQPAGGQAVFQSIDINAQTGPLTDSGLPILIPAMLAGAGVGFHRARRSSRTRNA